MWPSIVTGVVCLVLGGGVVLLYGRVKEKYGESKLRKIEDGLQDGREAKAKAIESQPPPTAADDVADAWDGMRRP